jgi:hypothetical protein
VARQSESARLRPVACQTRQRLRRFRYEPTARRLLQWPPISSVFSPPMERPMTAAILLQQTNAPQLCPHPIFSRLLETGHRSPERGGQTSSGTVTARPTHDPCSITCLAFFAMILIEMQSSTTGLFGSSFPTDLLPLMACLKFDLVFASSI